MLHICQVFVPLTKHICITLADTYFWLLADAIFSDEVTKFATRRIVLGSSTSDETFEFVQGCLNRCLRSHSLCRGIDKTALPSRVLDMGTSLDSTVKLWQGSKELGYYACLSHSWGTMNAVTTNSENLTRHLLGLPWEEMPRTFHDAITFAKRLGVRYIWIDSLCIIQDDPVDWECESAQMFSIYANAFITIAATSATGHHSGCFFEESTQHKAREVMTLQGNRVSTRVYARRRISHPT